MPRPKRIRRVNTPPRFKGFNPIGLSEETAPVLINLEEYESIRLSDFELHGQVEAARIMGVSRPTYARIYESARRKVAEAFVQCRPIVFEGGKVYFDSDWYHCSSCECWFNHPAKDKEIAQCALCGSTKITHHKGDFEKGFEGDVCICPTCGFEKVHTLGKPCNQETCESCQRPLTRKHSPHRHRNRNNNCNI